MLEVVRDFDDYQAGALRTLNRLTFLENVTHCVMGMAGEAGEFAELPYENREKRIGEIGDCMWYAAVCAHELGIKFSEVTYAAILLEERGCEFKHMAGEVRAMLYANRMIDLVKKSVFYGKVLDQGKLGDLLICYVAALISMSRKTSIMLLEAGALNIKKLYARYPDKFDHDRAINRNYSAESAAAGIEIG